MELSVPLPWVIFLGALPVFSVIAFGILLIRSRRQNRDGFRYDIEGARVAEYGVLRHIWVIPVLFTNVSHHPAVAPTMHATAYVESDRRTRLTRHRYRYVGEFRWDDDVVPSGLTFNPGIAIPARVTIELPSDETPRSLRVASLINGQQFPRIHGRVHPAVMPAEVGPVD